MLDVFGGSTGFGVYGMQIWDFWGSVAGLDEVYFRFVEESPSADTDCPSMFKHTLGLPLLGST